MEKYFDLDQQIVYLAIDKSVMFELSEIDIAKKLLRDNNYRNFVSCSKVKFAEFIDEHLMMYKTAEFKSWQAYFEIDCYVSEHLMKNLTRFERTLNSRISDYVSELMERKKLSNFEKNEIISKITCINSRNGVKFSRYNGNESWLYISEMSFGEMKQLLFWIYDNRRNDYFEVVKGYDFLNKQIKIRMDELNRLRNNLFHNKSTTAYLTIRAVKNKKLISDRIKLVKWVSEMAVHKELAKDVREICYYAQKYIENKNSLLIKVD